MKSASLAAVSTSGIYLFTEFSTPARRETCRAPLMRMEWALGETEHSQEPRQLNPREWGTSGPSLAPLTSLFLSNPSCGTWDVQVMDCAECGGWGSFPGLGWRGRLKTRLQKALGNIWLQICKSPQAVNELIPNLVQNKEEQLLPRVLHLPCNQDFNAQTRKAQRRRGCPRPPLSFLCAGHGKRAGEVPGGCCPVLQHRILQELPLPGPATSPQPQSCTRGNGAGSGLADPSRTLALQWMQGFAHFPW